MKKLSALLLVIAALSFTSSVFASETAPGDVIVVLRNTTGNTIKASDFHADNEISAVKKFVEASEVTLKQTFPALSEADNSIFMVVHSDKKSEQELLEEFRNRPDVKAVSLNHKVMLLDSKREPNDPEYYKQWALQAIKAPEVWSSYTGSDDVYAVVIDTGIDINHEDLVGNIAYNYSGNLTGYGKNPSEVDTSDVLDVDDHGTHCAGIIAAIGNNGTGVSGVNWRTKIIALRVFPKGGSAHDDDIAAALNYIARLLIENPDMKIASVNLSLGGFDNIRPEDRGENDAYWLIYKTLSNMNRAVICVSAGNETTEVGAPTNRDRFRSDGKTVYQKNTYCYPASFIGIENMLVVAASTRTNERADFSNFSRKQVQITAPGHDILSTVRSFVSQDTGLDEFVRYPYELMSGTSMASPYVAGVCAMLQSIFPDATANEIKLAIMGGANGDYLVEDGTSMYGLIDLKSSVEFLKRNRESNTKPVIADFKIPEPVVNQLYLFEFAASGQQPVTFTIDGDLPEGMAFENGFLYGVPTSIANNSITLRAENSYGSDSKTFSFNVSAGTKPVIPENLNVIPEIYRGISYDFAIAVTGSYPILWEVTDSNIPSDFNFHLYRGDGVFTVKPTQTGSYEFTVRASNSAGSDTRRISFTVAEPQIPVIEAKTLMGAVIGMQYGGSNAEEIIGVVSNDNPLRDTIAVTGTKPLNLILTGGSLPDGMGYSLGNNPETTNGGTIIIDGLPKEAGTFDFTLSVSNDYGTASQNFRLVVSRGAPEFVNMPNRTRLVMPLGVYSETPITYAVGAAPMDFSISSGVLPNGTDMKHGDIGAYFYGTPTETGSFDITLRAGNDEGSDSMNITVYVAEQALFLDSVLPDGKKGESYSYTIRTVNNVAGEFSAEGLPRGLTLSRSGTISGVPSVSGTFDVAVQVSTSDSSTRQTFPLNIKDSNGSGGGEDNNIPSNGSGIGGPSGGCAVSSCALYLAFALAALKFRKRV